MIKEHDYTWRDFEIIDTHTHVFPAKVSVKASDNIGRFYDLPAQHDGSCEELLANGSQYNIDRYVICSVATTPKQVKEINNFISAKQSEYDEFYGFGAMHPLMEGVGDEVERIIELGLHGIKLHPDFQKFQINDNRYLLGIVFILYLYVDSANSKLFLFHKTKLHFR